MLTPKVTSVVLWNPTVVIITAEAVPQSIFISITIVSRNCFETKALRL